MKAQLLMQKQHWFPLRGSVRFCLCLLVALGVGWWVSLPQEPSYQGKSLTEWQDEMIADRVQRLSSAQVGNGVFLDAGIAKKYEAPLNQMGTNMLPYLLWQLQDRDSKSVLYYKALISNLKLGTSGDWVADRNRARAIATFDTFQYGVLKGKSQSVAPHLLNLAWKRDDLRLDVITILEGMRINSEEFTALLVDTVSGNTDDGYAVRKADNILSSRHEEVLPHLQSLQRKAKAKGDTKLAKEIEEVIMKH